ncbi:acyl-CoA dehydrogenase [Frankia sp. R43]|uniref:acyl-CoA dehydrogenase family protein n=1 Tax=Frankia sp. R43 TaxID=269536 RepID=UPI0006CA27DB|nr:acyl-CoA dehydrogenase family protein [Frankia sp. R43]KPM51958.1 acyl-CoA dehydrogenase [Frankia sp. R43]
MDFSLTEEQRLARDSVRAFVNKELMPLESQFLRDEREGRRGLTDEHLGELQQKAKRSGFWGIDTPEEYGGANVGPIISSLIRMELSRTCIPFTFGGQADHLLLACNEEQKQEYLIPMIAGDRISSFGATEPGAGSDLRQMRTRAVRDGDDWIINGEKTFITMGNVADFVIMFAVTDPDKGSEGGVTCFLVDREMGYTSEQIYTMGRMQRAPATLSFQDVRVPHRNILGEEGWGFNLAQQWIGRGRISIASDAIGVSERLLQMAIDHAKNRVSMGHPIAEYQAIQWQIADSHVEIEALKLLTLLAAWRAEAGRDARHEAAMAKLVGGITANQVADRVLQIHGGMGYTKELPIEMWYREVRAWRIYEGTDEIQRRAIARNLFKGHVKLGNIGA